MGRPICKIGSEFALACALVPVSFSSPLPFLAPHSPNLPSVVTLHRTRLHLLMPPPRVRVCIASWCFVTRQGAVGS